MGTDGRAYILPGGGLAMLARSMTGKLYARGRAGGYNKIRALLAQSLRLFAISGVAGHTALVPPLRGLGGDMINREGKGRKNQGEGLQGQENHC